MRTQSKKELQDRLARASKALHLSVVQQNAARIAIESERQQRGYLAYLVELLEAQLEERRRNRATRRIKEAGFPVVKTLESFDFSKAKKLPETRIRRLFDGGYIDEAEPVIFIGEPGTGKTHLATALGEAAARSGKRVKFITAAALVTELVEARDAEELARTVARYGRTEVLIIDELAYIPLSKSDAELLFRILGDRNERQPTIITTNLPFSEWTSMFPDHRLCRAILDRLTHKAHIIETGTESIRLRSTLAKRENRSLKESGRS